MTNSIDFKKIYWYAQRAKLAYESPQIIQQQLPNVESVNTLDSINVQYFIEVLPDSQEQLVSVRGTANWQNAKEDAEFAKARDQRLGIYVHKGFDNDAMTVYRDLLPALDKSKAVLLTGHSLGAAISSLLMLYLYHDGFTVRIC